MASSSYYTAYQLTINADLLFRVAASAQQESEATGKKIDPQEWANARRWEWATQADWVAAVQAAQDTGITEWGKNPSVITDQHILSWVQPALAATPDPPGNGVGQGATG